METPRPSVGRRGPEERSRGADLGLYSITFNNDVELDRRTIEAYRTFRLEAEQKGFPTLMRALDRHDARRASHDLGPGRR